MDTIALKQQTKSTVCGADPAADPAGAVTCVERDVEENTHFQVCPGCVHKATQASLT